MPFEDKNGDTTNRLAERGIRRLRKLPKATGHSIVAKWPKEKRIALEREIVAQRISMKEIAAKFGVQPRVVERWKYNVLRPALEAARQTDNIEKSNEAKQHLDWLMAEAKDTITQVKSSKLDSSQTGTVATLLGVGLQLVQKIGEITRELAAPGQVPVSASGEQTIRAIIIPKIGDNVGIEMTSTKRIAPVDYSKVKPVEMDNQ